MMKAIHLKMEALVMTKKEILHLNKLEKVVWWVVVLISVLALAKWEEQVSRKTGLKVVRFSSSTYQLLKKLISKKSARNLKMIMKKRP